MTRFPMTLIVAATLLGAVGCRMCGSAFDYCMPAFTERADDYRGCDPMYRAGSIFNTDVDYSSYFNDPDYVEDTRYNAGDFGQTTPIDGVRSSGPTPLEPKSQSRPPIGIPPKSPSFNGNGTVPYIPDENDSDYRVPNIQDVIRITTPDAAPGIELETPKPNWPTPGAQPNVPPSSIETIPFTPENGEPSFTLEDLRRLDPTVTEIKIINVDDAINTAFPGPGQVNK